MVRLTSNTKRCSLSMGPQKLEKIRSTLISIHIAPGIAQIQRVPVKTRWGIRSSAHVAILLSPPSFKGMQSTVDHARDMTQLNAIPIFFSVRYAGVLWSSHTLPCRPTVPPAGLLKNNRVQNVGFWANLSPAAKKKFIKINLFTVFVAIFWPFSIPGPYRVSNVCTGFCSSHLPVT